jgi:hypothetical protein
MGAYGVRLTSMAVGAAVALAGALFGSRRP